MGRAGIALYGCHVDVAQSHIVGENGGRAGIKLSGHGSRPQGPADNIDKGGMMDSELEIPNLKTLVKKAQCKILTLKL